MVSDTPTKDDVIAKRYGKGLIFNLHKPKREDKKLTLTEITF